MNGKLESKTFVMGNYTCFPQEASAPTRYKWLKTQRVQGTLFRQSQQNRSPE